MSRSSAVKILGTSGTIIAIAMFVSLIEVARSNLSGNSNIFIQPGVTMINCTIWSTYAYMKKEWFLFWANVPGIFLGLFTVITAFI